MCAISNITHTRFKINYLKFKITSKTPFESKSLFAATQSSQMGLPTLFLNSARVSLEYLISLNFFFQIGKYLSSAFLSLCFLTLGAYLMYGTENDFSNSSAIFANQVITLYTQSIGSWSYLIISISGFSIMFGTCIAVLDGSLGVRKNVSDLHSKGKVKFLTTLLLYGQ